jgi:hypothetical protein
MKCRYCKHFKQFDANGLGYCFEGRPQIIEKILKEKFDIYNLLNASLRPVVLTDDLACSKIKLTANTEAKVTDLLVKDGNFNDFADIFPDQ